MAHIYSVSNFRLDFVRQTATSIKNQNVLSFEGETMNVPARLFRMTLRSLLIWLALSDFKLLYLYSIKKMNNNK